MSAGEQQLAARLVALEAENKELRAQVRKREREKGGEAKEKKTAIVNVRRRQRGHRSLACPRTMAGQRGNLGKEKKTLPSRVIGCVPSWLK